MNTTGKLALLNSQAQAFSQVLAMDQAHFPRPWTQENWLTLNWQHHQLYGYFLDNQLVGFALFARVEGDAAAHLLKICLIPACRGSLTSRDFWQELHHSLKQSEVESVFLEVEAKNQRAEGYYCKLGFQTLRTIRKYYSDGEDAHTMHLIL